MRKAEVRRVAPEETNRRLEAGTALLVCAYEADEKFSQVQLEGAISWNQFQERLPEISLNQEIILYCD